MATLRYLDTDVVPVFDDAHTVKGRERLATLLWGDSVKFVRKSGEDFILDFSTRDWDDDLKKYVWTLRKGYISAKTKFRDEPLMKVRFVDVGQGDAAIVESPAGKIIIIDGGEGQHLRRYMASSWAHVFRTKALDIAALVVSHGDADHFAGLPDLIGVERAPGKPAITVQRVFHNGLVKGPTSAGKEILGKTAKVDDETFITELEGDLTKVPESRMNTPFVEWKDALKSLKTRNNAMTIERLEYGDDEAFDFLAKEDITVQVLGPIVERVNNKPALRYLHTPGSSSLSASHTINGHSIVLRLIFKNVRILFGADLNEQSEDSLLARARLDNKSLASEVLKVPHHGSADFSPRILESIQPVVSVVSSGDENAAKEYIHPRAGLVGALGKYSRSTVERPLVYVTEMVAFFRRLGAVRVHKYKAGSTTEEQAASVHVQNAYEKTVFGIVHVRTDGERVLVVTHSGKADKKETYAFHVDQNGAITFE